MRIGRIATESTRCRNNIKKTFVVIFLSQKLGTNKKNSDYTSSDTIESYFLPKEQMPSTLRAPPIATGIINTLRKLASFCPVKHA